MRQERIDIWNDEEYDYPAAFGFQPSLRTYLHEDAEVRPCVLVIPGGGYRMVSPTEGEIVAKCFYDKGYQTFVGTYTTDYLGREPPKMQPLRDIARMVRLIRSRAEEFRVLDGRIVLCGFSAGAHLCGTLCVHWKDAEDPAFAGVSCRPDGAVLSYPVITSGELAHRDSFTALLGRDAPEEELAYMSLEKQVDKDTPPMFLWHTAEDGSVPAENSYLMAMALKNSGVPAELHVFPRGSHGLSLANEDWAAGRFGDPYTMEQLYCTAALMKFNVLKVSPEAKAFLSQLLNTESAGSASRRTETPVKEVSVWPELADTWIRENCLNL